MNGSEKLAGALYWVIGSHEGTAEVKELLVLLIPSSSANAGGAMKAAAAETRAKRCNTPRRESNGMFRANGPPCTIVGAIVAAVANSGIPFRISQEKNNLNLRLKNHLHRARAAPPRGRQASTTPCLANIPRNGFFPA